MNATSGARLWVVDPSLQVAEDEGVRELADGWSGSTRLFQPALHPGDGPAAGDGYDVDGVVVMGSAASVHDEIEWIRTLSAWLAPILDGRATVPLLGICFGHQLIAQLAGARVGFLDADRGKRVGVEFSQLDGGRLLPGRRELRVVVSHREAVQSVPAGYDTVASRPGVPIDGLEHRTLPIYSFQFHPEARGEFLERAGIDRAAADRRLIEDSRALLDAFRADALRRAARRGTEPAVVPPAHGARG